MGMSSSQARLLTLSNRLHDIEYKAQRLQAQKLQIANDSARAYEDYLQILDATKIQYKSIDSDGTVTFRDANLNILENGYVLDDTIYAGPVAPKTLFLQKQDGTVMITPAMAQKYGFEGTDITGDLDTYLESLHFSRTIPVPNGRHWENTGFIGSVTSIPNQVGTLNNITPIDNVTVDPYPGEPQIIECAPIENTKSTVSASSTNYSTFQNTVAPKDTSSMTNIKNIDKNNIKTEYVITDVEGLKYIENLYGDGINYKDTTLYLSSNLVSSGLDMTGVDWNGIKLTANITFDGNGVKIKNLGKNANATSGLFRSADNDCTIKNVGLENVNIVYDNNNPRLPNFYTGGLTDSLGSNSTIENCYVTGNIRSSEYYVGGLVGTCGSDTIIKNCSTNVNITTNPRQSAYSHFGAGGIVGGSDGHGLQIDSCWTTGKITQTSSSVLYHDLASMDQRENIGGILGYCDNGLNISNCIVAMQLIDGVNGGNIGGLVVGHDYRTYDGYSFATIKNTVIDYSKNSGLTITKNGDPIGAEVSQLSDYTQITTPSLKYISEAVDPEHEGVTVENGPVIAVGGQVLAVIDYVTMPVYEGGFYSNLYGALLKYYDGDATQISQGGLYCYCDALYSAYKKKTVDPSAIATINSHVCDYINDCDTTDGKFIEALAEAVKESAIYKPNETKGTLGNTTAAEFQTKYNYDFKLYIPAEGPTWTPNVIEAIPPENGSVEVPTKEDIADVLYFNFINEGYVVKREDVRRWVNSKYNSSTYECMKQLADMVNDINDHKIADIYTSYSATPQKPYVSPSSEYDTEHYDYSFQADKDITADKGLVSIPTVDNISDMLYYNLVKDGKFEKDDSTYTKDYIRNWVKDKYGITGTPTQFQMSKLADLNIAIQSGKAVDVFENTASYINATPTYPIEQFDFKFLTPRSINTTDGGGWVKDFYYTWDTSDPDIAKAIMAWTINRLGVEIVSEDCAKSYQYLKNVLENGDAVLTTFDNNAIDIMNDMEEPDRASLNYEDYDRILNPKNTSISVETSVQEVSDKERLEQAEAQYESDMNTLNNKDRDCDVKLAQFEQQRKATMKRMETLKKVAKDNIDMSFKLFS